MLFVLFQEIIGVSTLKLLGIDEIIGDLEFVYRHHT